MGGRLEREIELGVIGKGDVTGFTEISESFLKEKKFIPFKTTTFFLFFLKFSLL